MLGLLLTIVAASAGQAAEPAGTPAAAYRQAERLQAREPLRARALYEEAARQGHAPAQASLGILLFKEGDRTGALRWLGSAAEAGEPRALLIYGTAMFNGDGVAPNRIQGYAMVRRAAAQGSAEALATQSEMELVMPKAEREAGLKLAGATVPVAAEPAASAEAASPAAAERGTRSPRSGKRARRASTAPVRTAERPAEPSPAAAPLSSGGTWRVQLGAFRQPGAGQALFARLAPRLPGKQPAFVSAGAVTRLQVGPYRSLADAQAACRSLGQQACIPIRIR